MIVRDDGVVVSDSSFGQTYTFSKSESHSSDSHFQGDLLMVRRLIEVEVLSRGREEYRQPALHKSERSHDEGHYSERSVSSRAERMDRHDGNSGNKRMKVRLVTLEFSDYALVWWNQVLEDIRRVRKDPCESWG
ncbi:hypothetical protein CR513_11684, partial [Mucuna pruriens]